MRTKMLLVLVALVLVAVACLRSTPSRVHAEPLVVPVGVQVTPGVLPQGLALGIAAACASDPACVAVVTLAATTFCAEALQVGVGVCGYTALTHVRDRIVAWYTSGDSPGKTDFVNQFGEHTNTYTITQNMLDAWWTQFAAFSGEGWTHSSDTLGLGIAAWISPAIGSVGSPSTMTLTTVAYPFPVSACFGMNFEYNVLQGLTGTAGSAADWRGNVKVEMIDALSGSVYAAVTNSTYSIYHSPAQLLLTSANVGGDVCAAAQGQSVKFRVTYPAGSGTLTGAQVWVKDVTWIGASVWSTSGGPKTYLWTQAGDYTSVGTAALPMKPNAGTRIRMVADPDELVNWVPGTSLPLADGSTANPVVADPTTPGTSQNTGFWEGLFGGLTDGLGAVKDVLTHIYSGVTTIAADVVALPDTIVAAFAAAFTPTVPLATHISNVQTAYEGRVPFSYPTAIFDGMGGWFAGGSSCPSFMLPGYAPYFADYTYEMCPPTEFASLSRALSDVFAVVALMFWAYNLMSSFIGGTGSTGGGGGGGDDHSWSW